MPNIEVIHVSTFGHSVFVDSDSYILLALPQIGCSEKNKIRFRDKKIAFYFSQIDKISNFVEN